MAKTTFIAAGDAFVTRRLPKDGYEGFQSLKALIEQHDVKFLNLESTFHNNECCPAAESGGTWAMSDPQTLDDMKDYGFNLFNTANNHSGDFGIEGVLATVRNLKQRDMIFSGTGKDLGEASKPCYLETKDTRVALISCCSSMSNSFRAGAQTGNMPGRPGLNPMRYTKIYHLDPAHFEMAQKVAAASGINAAQEKSIRNGYSLPPKEGTLPFAGNSFVLDDRCWVESTCNKQDLQRITDEIMEAKRQADVVLVSIHSHVLDGADNTQPALFLEKFSKACIDAGASVIIGQGPHELQGIEKYKDGLILYSIGNFIFQTETVEFQPWDAYANKGMSLDTKVGAYMNARSANGTKGYCVQWPIWNAVLPSWTMEDGKITALKLYPYDLGMEKPRSQKGVPVLNGSVEILEYMRELCKPFGTEIDIQDGIGIVRL